MATRFGKTFTVEVRSRKKLQSLVPACHDTETAEVREFDPRIVSSVHERTQEVRKPALQVFVHRSYPADQAKLLKHKQAVEGSGTFSTPHAEVSLGKARILPDLTVGEHADVLKESRPSSTRKSPAARRQATIPAKAKPKPESVAAKAAIQDGRPSVPEGTASTNSAGQSDKHGTVASAQRKRPPVRDWSGKSLQRGQRWKRRLPKVCW